MWLKCGLCLHAVGSKMSYLRSWLSGRPAAGISFVLTCDTNCSFFPTAEHVSLLWLALQGVTLVGPSLVFQLITVAVWAKCLPGCGSLCFWVSEPPSCYSSPGNRLHRKLSLESRLVSREPPSCLSCP